MLPANRVKMLLLASAALVVVGIAAGVKIEQALRLPTDEFFTASELPFAPAADIPYSASTTQLSPLPVQTQYAETSAQPLLSAPLRAPDEITARAYIVGNVMTGHVYMSLAPTDVLPVASMSKLITAIAATDTMSPTTTITITPEETNVPVDGSGIHAGETFALNEILYPLLLDSSNVAAEAIASSSDRQKFLELMSSYAWEIGMPTAYFADPSGLSPHNDASADDMFALARYLYIYRPDILAITRTAQASTATTSEHDAHNFDSIHPFVTDPRFIGGKTGRTVEAGETMMTLLRIGGQPISFILLGSDSGRREADTDLLIQKFEALTP